MVVSLDVEKNLTTYIQVKNSQQTWNGAKCSYLDKGYLQKYQQSTSYFMVKD